MNSRQLEKEKVLFYAQLFSHTKKVGKKIGLGKAFELLGENLSEKRVKWFRERKKEMEKLKKDASGERKLIEFFWREAIPSISKKNFNVKEETRHVSFIEFNGFCPIIKACLKNQLNTELACTHCCEKPFNAVVKEFETNSEFRVVDKRSGGKGCEYMIIFKPKKVNETVNAFIMNKGKLLLLKRVNRINNYPRKWNVVAGYLNEMNPLKRTYMEIEEETGLKIKDLRLVRKAKKFRLKDNVLGKTWIVNAFLFETGKKRVKLNWEHSAFRWIKPEELKTFDSVFGLEKAVEKVMD